MTGTRRPDRVLSTECRAVVRGRGPFLWSMRLLGLWVGIAAFDAAGSPQARAAVAAGALGWQAWLVRPRARRVRNGVCLVGLVRTRRYADAEIREVTVRVNRIGGAYEHCLSLILETGELVRFRWVSWRPFSFREGAIPSSRLPTALQQHAIDKLRVDRGEVR